MPRYWILGLGLVTSLIVTGSAPCQEPSPSFLNDVLPVLTRLGCNQGACHGKLAGQNGFRLSLRGYAPEWDHLWLTREFGSRRINLAVPETSLLLRKPLGQVPHAGGKLFEKNSRAHQVLLSWIQAGMPGPRKEDATITGLRVQPERETRKPGEEFSLRVTAEYSDGRTRDVTWLTQFASSDAGIAEATADGTVRVARPGEAAIRAMFQGQVAVSLVTAPYDQSIPAQKFARRNNFIDDHVFAKLAALKIEPAELCDDATFLRRGYLDTIGLLPTPEEVRAFLTDRNPHKRSQVIDRLLERPEFVDFWALQLGDLLQNRKESDHDVRGTKGVRNLHDWLRQQVAINRPWNELVHELLTVTGSTAEHPAVGYFIVTVGEKRQAAESTVVAAVAQTFLGSRIGCAQCHNHPSEKYTQDDYYHFAGFFSRLKLDRKDPKKGPTTLAVSHPDAKQNGKPVGFTQPRTGQFLAPRPLDRSSLPVAPDADPRQALAEWITRPENDFFAGAQVNRLWAHFFGTGLVEPVDDLRTSNPPSNPELWKALVQEFIGKNYDRKHLMRVILNSRTYQLSSFTTPGNEKDHRFYSHFPVRRLSAEVLLDALARATEVPDRFEGYPIGVRAVQVPDPAVKSAFLGLFGRSERITACACERNGEVTLPQLLHLQGGDTALARTRDANGRVSRLLKGKMKEADLIEELFLATFSRSPRMDEQERLLEHWQQAREQGVAQQDFLQDVLWALLNSKEFAFQH